MYTTKNIEFLTLKVSYRNKQVAVQYSEHHQ